MDIRRTIEFILEQQTAAAAQSEQWAAEAAAFGQQLRELDQASSEYGSTMEAYNGWLQGVTASLDRVAELHQGLVRIQAQAQEELRESSTQLSMLMSTVQDLAQCAPQQV